MVKHKSVNIKYWKATILLAGLATTTELNDTAFYHKTDVLLRKAHDFLYR